MFNRRTVIKGALVAPALWLSVNSKHRAAAQGTDDYGVASGDPRSDGVVLWTRVPEAFQNGGPLTVHFEVSLTEDFASVVVQGSVTTDASRDFTVKMRTGGLEPFTRYYYRFTTDTGYTSVTGRTRTAPDPDSSVEQLTFAYVSCQDYTQGFYTVYAAICQDDDADYCIHLGDNIYETGAAGFQNGQVREDTIGGGEAKTLEEYRAKYKLYLSDPDFREVRRLFCWIHLWDDHEVFNNYAGRDLVSEEQKARQLAGYTAFLEYLPVEPVTPLTVVDDKAVVRLYRKLSFGALADLFVLDLRQFRDGVVCASDFLSPGCPELEDPSRTMLGYQQRSWLKKNLLGSQARWKVLLNEMMLVRFVAFDIGADGRPTGKAPRFFSRPRRVEGDVVSEANGLTLYINLDAWDGYPAERTELLSFIADKQIRNVVVWTGDIHNCYAGVLKPDFTDPASPPVAVEVVGGSVSSAGVFELLGSLFDPTALAAPLLQQSNPYIEYVDLKYHVYTKAVLTRESMQVSYRAVETITETVSASFTLQSFTIPDGESQLLPS
ncbi:alkaline phosphatase D family protein [Gloeobacter morelensis]|uniref:Alkaline phosphatase D family protein n=1 Tax=Gloeobacter morelensis MG652769 TaxID=2781736 RepID=A0ABY3PKZ6_9CYAN|nr:alkaline phosphatase D family protein [Gloeobacter morelensis]UFP94298.1 alkaline phosphatase D family protein [Gloeobacter morelensis MG652769]